MSKYKNSWQGNNITWSASEIGTTQRREVSQIGYELCLMVKLKRPRYWRNVNRYQWCFVYCLPYILCYTATVVYMLMTSCTLNDEPLPLFIWHDLIVYHSTMIEYCKQVFSLTAWCGWVKSKRLLMAVLTRCHGVAQCSQRIWV